MTSQVFYRKWRPQTLAEVMGQEPVTTTLANALATGRVAHAYLFCGPRGTGKTSTGRILAKAVNCLSGGKGEPCNQCAMCEAISEGRALDLVEIDAASNRGIDEIRELREKISFAPNVARYKVYIIDEVHMLTEPAFNALLKTLEEPPPHAIFILATTEVHKVPLTILSRCQRFDFRRISQQVIVARLKDICDKEGIEVDEQALGLVARAATGSLRDAENLLEQLVTYYGDHISMEQAQAELGITGDRRVGDLAAYILNREVAAGLAIINQVAADGIDLRQFSRELVEHLRGMLLVKAGAEEAANLPAEMVTEMKQLGAVATIGDISRAVRLFARLDFRTDPQATLPLELALVDCALATTEEAKQPQPRIEVARPAPRVAEPETPAAKELPAPVPVSKPAELSVPGPPHDIEAIRHYWKEFVRACKGEGSSGNLDALLRGFCQPLAIEGDTLVLGFTAEFHKSKIEDPKYRHLVERKLNEVFGTAYRVRCTLTPKAKPTRPPDEQHDPLIDEALRMGAKIIDEE